MSIKSLLIQTKELLKSRKKVKPADRTFLVVDDDTDSRQTLAEYLRSFGYKKVLEAKDGKEALDALAQGEIDFIISDWEMPNASGLELLKALKDKPEYRDIPFIMVTSPISQERNKVENAAALNVDGYIIKPFRAQVLQDKIHEALTLANIRGRKGCIVVDDDDTVRQTIVEYLESMGYSPIYQAHDGEEGFGLLRQHQDEIAFVVSDWEMPKMAGIELLKRIRQDPLLASTPFIMATSQTSIERLKVEQALAADVDHYLLKPFRATDLKAKVEIVMSKAKANVALEKDLGRGEECLQLFRWDDAIKAFKAALATDGKSVRAHVGMGIAHRGLGDEKSVLKGVQYFRKGIALAPTADEAYIELALTFEHARAVDHAMGVLRDGIAASAFSEKLHFHLGRLLLMKGQTEEGMAELKKALEINPEFEEAKTLLQGRESGRSGDE